MLITTEVLTTTESLSSSANTLSLTSIESSHFAVPLRPPASDTVSVSILPITNLPSLSVEQTATSSDSQAPTATSFGVPGSPAVILSAKTLLAGQNANLPSL